MTISHNITNSINRLFEQAPYFSINALREYLAAQNLSYKPDTVKVYLSRLKTDGVVFGAGRGWYSSLSEPYQLDTEPVEKLVGELKEAFPLLDFACWSTAQLNDLLLHQLAKHVRFAYVERDAMKSVADWLRENRYRPTVNPGKKERISFSVEDNSVVVLPLTTKTPQENGFAKIEKIIEDVLADVSDFSIINIPEFIEGACSAITSNRIDIADLFKYSTRRKEDVSPIAKNAVINQRHFFQ
jgi:Txe/YoeB family toxin of Txe-Axe toxin-antitoxin module